MYIKDLLAMYKSVEQKNADKNLFYKKLRKHIINDLKDKENNIDVLESYRMSCETSIEADFLNLYLNGFTILIALLSIMSFENVSIFLSIILIVLDITIVIGIIYLHNKRTHIHWINQQKMH